jgi:glycosyltransferase involved in cell wall biosynthesis
VVQAMDVKKNRKRVLYITYDGLTDPLGQSQILPYIIGLSENYDFTILSCEKKDKLATHKHRIDEICRRNHLAWKYTFFKRKPPIIAKLLDLYALKKKAIKLYKRDRFDLIHCRSYISIEIGLLLKKKFGVKVVFDMRGFWVDERVDGGLWNLKNPIFKIAYKRYKNKEAYFVANADHIISLTEVGKRELMSWPSYNPVTPVSVIPCMVDFSVFNYQIALDKEKAKQILGFSEDNLVVSYLGSLGTWYLLDEMLDVFKEIKTVYPLAKFLFITPDKESAILPSVREKGLQTRDFKILFATRAELPAKIKASDVSLVFIKTCYSKLASSPTKLGELMAMGVPVICNEGVGDVDIIIQNAKGGLSLKDFSTPSIQAVVQKLPSVLRLSPAEISESINSYYNLLNGVSKYQAVYQRLLQENAHPERN